MQNNKYISIKLADLFYYIAFFLIALYSILEGSTSTFSFMSPIRIRLFWIATFCCALLFNEFISDLSSKRFQFNLLATTLFIILLFAGWYLSETYIHVRVIARMAAYVSDIFILTVTSANNNRLTKCIRLLLVISIFLCIINDFIDLTGIVTFPMSYGSILKKYFLGTKFNVVYLHLNTLALFITDYLIRNKFDGKKIILVYVALVGVLGISIYVDCSTGILGSVVFAIFFSALFRGNQRITSFLSNKYTFAGFIAAATLMFLVLQEIVSIAAVTDFIVNQLKRDPTLTGRLIIFALFIPTMNGHWLWGYGLGTAFEVSKMSFGVADAQNLVLQWMIQIGIIPVVAMILWLMSYFARVSFCNNKTIMFPIISLLYAYIFMGIGEITMDYSFFMYVFLLANIANYQKRVESLDEN